MPAPLLPLAPCLLAAVTALLLEGLPARLAVIGVALVALATVASAKVPDGTPSFRLINGGLFCGGLLLFVVGVALSVKRSGSVISVPLATELPRPPEASRSRATLRRWGMPVILGVLLVPSLWFVITVAGPDARSLQGLHDAPFSAAGETLLAALLLPATLALAGTWPFSAIASGPRLAPLGALLLLAVVVPMAGEGLAHWRSLYAGWLVLGALVAAGRPSWLRLMASAGLFAIACGSDKALWAGTALTIVASVLSLRPVRSGWFLRLAYFVAGACGIVALRETVEREVVYSVLLLVAVVIASARTPKRAAEGGQ